MAVAPRAAHASIPERGAPSRNSGGLWTLISQKATARTSTGYRVQVGIIAQPITHRHSTIQLYIDRTHAHSLERDRWEIGGRRNRFRVVNHSGGRMDMGQYSLGRLGTIRLSFVILGKHTLRPCASATVTKYRGELSASVRLRTGYMGPDHPSKGVLGTLQLGGFRFGAKTRPDVATLTVGACPPPRQNPEFVPKCQHSINWSVGALNPPLQFADYSDRSSSAAIWVSRASIFRASASEIRRSSVIFDRSPPQPFKNSTLTIQPRANDQTITGSATVTYSGPPVSVSRLECKFTSHRVGRLRARSYTGSLRWTNGREPLTVHSLADGPLTLRDGKATGHIFVLSRFP